MCKICEKTRSEYLPNTYAFGLTVIVDFGPTRYRVTSDGSLLLTGVKSGAEILFNLIKHACTEQLGIIMQIGGKVVDVERFEIQPEMSEN